jgi:hypothetical protein
MEYYKKLMQIDKNLVTEELETRMIVVEEKIKQWSIK